MDLWMDGQMDGRTEQKNERMEKQKIQPKTIRFVG